MKSSGIESDNAHMITLTSLLIAVVIAGLIVWLFERLPVAEPFKTIGYVLLALILILWLLGKINLGI